MVPDNIVLAVLRNHPTEILGHKLAMEKDYINNITFSGRSLLFTAVSAGSVEAAKALCSVGAYWRDQEEKVTLFRKAQRSDSASMMKALIITGAFNLSFNDGSGYTYLHIAATRGLVSIAEMLIDLGIDIDARSQYQLTPLHIAAMKDSLPVVKVLLSRGADVGKRTDKGYSALHLAACLGNCSIIEVLCAAGADINLRDYSNRTPLDLALLRDQTEAAKLLRSKGGFWLVFDNLTSIFNEYLF